MLFPSSIQNIQPTWLFSSYQAGEVSFLVSEINLILLLVLKYLHSSIVFTPLYNFLTCFQSIDSFLFKQAEEAQPTHTHTHTHTHTQTLCWPSLVFFSFSYPFKSKPFGKGFSTHGFHVCLSHPVPLCQSSHLVSLPSAPFLNVDSQNRTIVLMNPVLFCSYIAGSHWRTWHSLFPPYNGNIHFPQNSWSSILWLFILSVLWIQCARPFSLVELLLKNWLMILFP